MRRIINSILIVDDEEEYRSFLPGILGRVGYQCRTAEGVDQALSLLDCESFQLVLTDIRMAGRDGLELIREGRKSYPEVDFIAMTGHVADYFYSDIIAAGATDFLAKPFEAGQLTAKIERIEREKQTLEDLRTAHEAVTRQSETNALFAEISKVLISPLTFETISDLVLDAARRLTGSPLGFAGFIDKKTGFLVAPTLTRAVWDECRMEGKSAVFQKFGGLWGLVLKDRTPILSNSVKDDPRSSGLPAGHISIARFLSVPALSGSVLLGQLAVANATGEYSRADLDNLQRLADIYALAIERKWKDAELKAAQEELQKARDELEGIAAERMQKLSKAGALLQRSLHRMKEITEE